MNEKTIQVDRKHALQTFLVSIKAKTVVIATDDLPDEPGDDMDLVEVGVACSDDASSKGVSSSDHSDSDQNSFPSRKHEPLTQGNGLNPNHDGSS